ncbi:MAG TPA: serine hydrolase domain-containing protein [Chitinophagaceae bacterium]|nr:serine hydrolase domain-containing protein [Chitinophagaceae bacterium]
MKKLFIFICLSATCFSVFPQPVISSKNPLKETSPESAGVSSTRLQKIDSLFKEYIDNRYLAGAVAIIARGGKIVYYKASGYDDMETKTPLKKDVIFRIASQTKAITSVAIMMLYEDGKLLLDDNLSKYIPEYKNTRVIDQYNEKDTTYTTVPAKREITIRDLLTHTSGIDYAQIGTARFNAIYYKNGIIDGIGIGYPSLAETMKKLASMPLAHQPGEKWTYGLNSDLLGYLVEVASGMSLDQFFRKRIFEPLGMKDTYFYLPREKYNRLANLFTEDASKHVTRMNEHININGDFYRDYPASPGNYYSGGGGLSSTALDYTIFLQMLLNGGTYNGKRLLSRASVRMMTTNQVGDLTQGVYYKFGLGFQLVAPGSSAYTPFSDGSFTWGGMFSSLYWVDPAEKLVVQLVLQLYPNSHRDMREKFKMLVYQALND